jgi:hypothetical protein
MDCQIAVYGTNSQSPTLPVSILKPCASENMIVQTLDSLRNIQLYMKSRMKVVLMMGREALWEQKQILAARSSPIAFRRARFYELGSTPFI